MPYVYYILYIIMLMDESHIQFTMNERSVRALHTAVCVALEKWTGQGELDQDLLLDIKPALQGCVFEFDFNRNLN